MSLHTGTRALRLLSTRFLAAWVPCLLAAAPTTAGALAAPTPPGSETPVDARVACGTEPVFWDNCIISNGLNGRAVSPPQFPSIRVVDDITISFGLSCTGFHVDVIEDGSWVPGATMETYIRYDSGGVPAPGQAGIAHVRTGTFARQATGETYFGRAEYRYCQLFSPPIDLTPTRYWIGLRNPGGGGSGTNYWMLSDGGPDGIRSSTGFFSLDGGATFMAEGTDWHHAFEVSGGAPLDPGACCHDSEGTCEDAVPPEDCTGRFAPAVLCADLDPPCGSFNDECIDAIPIMCGETVHFDNREYTRGSDPPVCAPGGGQQELDRTAWFHIRPTAERLFLGTCQSNGGETVLAIFEDTGDCANLGDPIECDFEYCPPYSGVCAQVTPGRDYLVMVGNPLNRPPTFVHLTATCDERCPVVPPCSGAPIAWDNNPEPNGRNSQCVSPPACGSVEVVDDFDLGNEHLQLNSLRVAVVEDDTWLPGASMTAQLRRSAEGGGPAPGSSGVFRSATRTPFFRTATGYSYFGRREYVYCFPWFTELPPARYWISFSNSGATGTGSNYWLTSDGGPDGAGTSPPYRSQDGGESFASLSASWQMAFRLRGFTYVPRGACCLPDGNCIDTLTRLGCQDLGGYWQGENTVCRDIDCPELGGACCRGDECTIETRPECEQAPDRGKYLGYGTTCENDRCLFGACCMGDECIATTRQEDCAGIWFRGDRCEDGFGCSVPCVWDNNLLPSGTHGRALSPPLFPNIRIVDDVIVREGSCDYAVYTATVVEDGAWVPGRDMELYVFRDAGNKPQGGGEGLLLSKRAYLARQAIGTSYFGREAYEHAAHVDLRLPQGQYWIGSRVPEATGGGTDYWLTSSDGGPDGMNTRKGFFSLDAGVTWQEDDSHAHYCFKFDPQGPRGACCFLSGVCSEDEYLADCNGRFAWNNGCGAFDPPCVNGACCETDGTCVDDVPSDQCAAPRFEPDTRCAELDPPCNLAGACCPRDGDCAYPINEEDCDGRWTYATSCEDRYPECLPLGACCRHDGECFDDVDQSVCVGRFTPVDTCADIEACDSLGGAFCESERFTDWDGDPKSDYATASDAEGARLAIGADGAVNRFGVRTGAVYLYERDPDGRWWGSAKVTPDNGVDDDSCGGTIHLFGDVLLARNGWSKVLVFEQSQRRWIQTASLSKSTHYSFGVSLAAADGLLFVGDQYRDGSSGPGVVYVYHRSEDGGWEQAGEILPLDSRASDDFGTSVAFAGGELFVGAPRADLLGRDEGAIYVFRREGETQWVQVAKLTAPDAENDDRVGVSLAVDGGRMIIGAPYARGWLGKAYIFRRQEDEAWVSEARLDPDPAGEVRFFGRSVDLRGNVAALGSDEHDGNNAPSAAYVFARRGDGTWVQVAAVRASDTRRGDEFGRSVVLVEEGLLATEAPWTGRPAHLFALPCADVDNDGFIDLADLRSFYNCLTGPGGVVAPSCLRADLDFDGDADLADFRILQVAFEQRR